VTTTALRSGLWQFRTIEVASFEKLQRYFVNPSLAPIEFEFLSVFRSWTACAYLWFIYDRFGLRSNDNPCSTLRARDTRAHNAMGHTEIIWAAGLLSLFASLP
jgi:hypothetical protein